MLGGDARAAVRGLASGGKADDQLGIAEDRDVGVVGGEKELPALLLLAHARDDALGDEAVVEIVLRLIDDERRFGLEQQQEQDRGGLLAGGEVIERLPRRGLPGGSRN